MRTHKWLVIVVVVLLLAGIAGCAPPKKEAPPPAPAPSGGMVMEDPAPIINQMNQAADDINAKVKANQIPQAKQSATNLAALNERLKPHFTDTAFRDELHRAIQSLNEEVNKAAPNTAEIDKRAQAVKRLLQQAPTKVMQKH